MADVHYQGFVPHRPSVPMVRSMSFHGLPTGHGIWQTPASPLDIPGASPSRPSRRLPYLLSVSVPDNADAVLSRSLLEQCRLDSISDYSPRSSSLRQYGSWTSKVFSEASSSSNKASLSTCASSNVRDGETNTHSSIVDTDRAFPKKKYSKEQSEVHASALSAGLRETRFKQEEDGFPKQIEHFLAPFGGPQEGFHTHTKALNNRQDDHKTAGLPRRHISSTGVQPVLPIQIPSNQRFSPTTLSNSASSNTGTDSDWSNASSPGFIRQSNKRKALVDRLMEYCYTILAHNYTEFKGDSPTSYAPSSTSSSSQGDGSGQATQAPERSGSGKSKKRSSHKESDASGGSDEDEDGQGPGSKKIKMEENLGKRLACPFFKRNPQRYQEERSCVGPGWRTVHRLKEHLYRCHTLPIHCLRCHETFPDEESLQTHSLSDTPCQRRRSDQPQVVLEGIGLAQERRLRSRKRTNKAEEDKWRDAYQICFPDDTTVPSPYYEIPALSESITSASSSGLVQYEDFVRSELPRRVRLELDRRLEQEWIPIEERLRSQLTDMMRDIQLTLLEEFRLRCARSTTESVPASTPSTNQPNGPTPQRQRQGTTEDCASVGTKINATSATASLDDRFIHDPPFAGCSASRQPLEGYKSVETSRDYTEMPLFGSWYTTQQEDFMISRQGELETLSWNDDGDALGCFVPDVEDWARSWGTRAIPQVKEP